MTNLWQKQYQADRKARNAQRDRARNSEFADRVAFYLGANPDRRVIMHFTGTGYELSTPQGEHLGIFPGPDMAADFAARHDLPIERREPAQAQAQGLGPS